MSQDDIQREPGTESTAVGGPRNDIDIGVEHSTDLKEPAADVASSDRDPDDTVGTGTSIALGCIAGTILLIVIGLIFVGIAAIL